MRTLGGVSYSAGAAMEDCAFATAHSTLSSPGASLSSSWPGCYKTPAAFGVPNASQRGTKSVMADKWAQQLHNPYRFGGPQHLTASDMAVAHWWAGWLHNPCRLGGPRHFTAGDKSSNRLEVGRVATKALPSCGSPTLKSGGQNQQWPTSGPGGCITLAAGGVPGTSERPGKISCGPQVGPVST